MWIPSSLKKLIENLRKLPGIGERSAYRIAYFLIKYRDVLNDIVDSLEEVDKNVTLCKICHGFAEGKDICPICEDERRDAGILCIVEKPEDVFIVESAGLHGWKYHVLGGLLSPVKGVTPDKLNIFDLRDRIKNENFKEIVIALNPNIEAEATSNYLTDLLDDMNVVISKIAIGLPQGADIALLDPYTIKESIKGRRRVK